MVLDSKNPKDSGIRWIKESPKRAPIAKLTKNKVNWFSDFGLRNTKNIPNKETRLIVSVAIKDNNNGDIVLLFYQ